MKLFVAVLMMILGLALAEVINHNGQPGCKTDGELSTKIFRNIWDPTRYWECKVKGQNAVAVRCPDGLGYLDSLKTCVEWENWDWEVPVNPPSRAA